MATITVSENGRISVPNQVYDNVSSPSYKWFSLQQNVLDGTYHPMDATQQVGWWGTTVSDVNGLLSPAPTLTITDTIAMGGIEIFGDSLLNNFPVDFTVQLYNGATLLYTLNITGNTQVNFTQVLPQTYNITSIVYTFTRINKAGHTINIIDVVDNILRVNSADTLAPKLAESSFPYQLLVRGDALAPKAVDTSFFTHYEIWKGDVITPKTDESENLTNIYTVMDQDVRQVYGKVVITYTDPYMDETIQVTSNQVGVNTSPQQLADNVVTPAFKWLSLQNNVLDGSYHPLDTSGEYSVGLWGTELSNPDGTLTTPMVITITFSARTLQSLRLAGDSVLNEFPVNFTFTAYDPNNNLLGTWPVTGNALVDYKQTISPVYNVAKVQVSISKINKGGVVPKLTEMYTAIVETYYNDDIESIQILEETGYATGGLPIGNISANEVDITLANLNNKFSLTNTQSSVYGLIKRNRRVEVYFGAVIVPAQGIEWYPMGTFWTTNWDIQKNMISTSLTARDRLELMRVSQFNSSQVYQNYTLYSLFQLILNDAGLLATQYSLDTNLQNVTIPYAWFDRMSHRDALARLASCGIIQVFCTKDNLVKVQMNFACSPTVMTTFTEDKNIYNVKYPLAVQEQTNWIDVTVANWAVGASTTVYDYPDYTTVPANGTITVTYELDQIPSLNLAAPTVTADTGVTVQSYQTYAWGMNITFANSNATVAGVHHVTITGQPLTQTSSRVLNAQDPNSISSDGVIKQTVQHDFIQDPVYAQNLANSILTSYSQGRHDVTLDNRGNVALRLTDQIDVNDNGNLLNYMITRQSIQWAGYLSATTEARKL